MQPSSTSPSTDAVTVALHPLILLTSAQKSLVLPSTTDLAIFWLCINLMFCFTYFTCEWYWHLVLRMISATNPLFGLLLSSHILCHKRDFFRNGSTCSFQPITILCLLPRVAEPLTGFSAASTHALVMPVYNLFRLSWWILQLQCLQFIPSHISKFSRLLDTASLWPYASSLS